MHDGLAHAHAPLVASVRSAAPSAGFPDVETALEDFATRWDKALSDLAVAVHGLGENVQAAGGPYATTEASAMGGGG